MTYCQIPVSIHAVIFEKCQSEAKVSDGIPRKAPVTNEKGRIRTPEVAKRRGALMVKNEYDSNYSTSTYKM